MSEPNRSKSPDLRFVDRVFSSPVDCTLTKLLGQIDLGQRPNASRTVDGHLRLVEIEHRLDAHPKVEESAVIGQDHPDLGQEVKAIVVPVAGDAPSEDELAAWVGETLAQYKVPSIWEIRSEPLPRNATGKVLKKLLTGEAQSELVEE